ncbi:unnamed protein product [Aphanomyces euteiches]
MLATEYAKGLPYPVPEEAEHIQSNKAIVEKAAEEERERRLEEMHSHECESAIVREINIEYAIACMETERIRRVSQHNMAEVHNELLRDHSKKQVVELMEEERGRRVSQENLALVHDELHRERSKQRVVVEIENERHRRMSESSIAEVHSHLLRRNSIDKVVQLAEEERERRIQEHQDQTTNDQKTRLEQQLHAVGAMETERARRLSTSQHLEKVASLSSVFGERGSTVSDLDAAVLEPLPDSDDMDYPELPVASSNPQQEQKALYGILIPWILGVSYGSLDLQMALKDVLKPSKNETTDALRNLQLLRFLRGHKGNVEIAAERYRTMLELREKHHLDAIRESIVLGNMTAVDFPYYEKIKRYVPAAMAFDVEDDDHNVFTFEKLGAFDLYGLVVNVSDDEWLAYCLHELESRAWMLDQRSLEHKTLVRCTTLRDLDGFSLTRVTRPVLHRVQSIISLASACYPESVHKVVFLNTPWIFHTAWRGIQLWLDESQRQKICMLKRGDKIDAICPLSKLPVLMGGTNDHVVLPPTGLLGKDSYALLRENGATEAEIRARDVLTVPFRVNANDTLCWEFCVLKYDVDFAIKFRTQGDGGAVELDVQGWEKSRFVHGQVEAASWTAPAAGVAVLCWDNSFSWTRAKTICYKASVAKTLEPDTSFIDISGHGSL